MYFRNVFEEKGTGGYYVPVRILRIPLGCKSSFQVEYSQVQSLVVIVPYPAHYFGLDPQVR